MACHANRGGWWPRLRELAARHELPDGAATQLAALLEVVARDPHAPTAVRDPDEAVDVHLADSLSGLAVAPLRSAGVIADVGSGAGFPALPLAVALPDARVHLLESIARKCAFLERAAEAAGAANATIACTRAEAWAGDQADVVTARAVAPLAVLVEYAAPLLRVGGVLVAWKGRPEPAEELAADRAAETVGCERADVHPVEPFRDAGRRRLYVYRKAAPTPAGFPRRPGLARKRPLGA